MSLSAVNSLRLISRRSFSVASVLASKGDYGSGVGHGGGSGGSIREAGGKFGEIEAAAENVYFKKLEAEQLKALRKSHVDEIKHHEEEIERHKEAIKRLRKYQEDLKKAEHKEDA